MSRFRFLVLLVLVLIATQVGTVSAQQRGSASESQPAASSSEQASPRRTAGAVVDGKLLEQLEVSETARFVVEFRARPDLSKAAAVEGFAERGQAVIDALQKAATGSQRQAKNVVAARGGTAESFWFRNVMIVEGDAALVEALSKLNGVKEIRPERIYPLVRPVARTEAIEVAVGAPEWGVSRIGADGVWAEGILGGGVVVANIDTGVDFTHPALANQYRGNLGDGNFLHDYNWWDPTGICGSAPCDNAEHGTHVMGTMVGGDGPGPFTPDIGVAPGAQWIAAKGCEDFGCSEFALLSSGQWILAPTDLNGENPDPSKRPDIVNNSWGGGPGDTFYLETVQNWRAAGIVPVFAAGNPGPFCGEGGSPGDYTESYSVGATDINDVIADFSGRGPSAFGKVNPDVSAPGVSVTSSVPGGGYASFSGTSMAAPHVAGSLALMLSAAPDLVGDVAGLTGGLSSTAFDIVDLTCGGDDDGDPNNVYGDGRIDAVAAVQLVATGGTLTGKVTNGGSGAAIPGAAISANNGERSFTTYSDSGGQFKLFLAQDLYLVTASAFGFETKAAPGIEIITDQTTVQDFALEALPTFTLRGTVRRAENNARVADATVQALGVPVAPVKTDRRGAYSLTLPLGTYTVEASQGGCLSRDRQTVELFANTRLDFSVVQNIDNFGHACTPIPYRWVDATMPTTVYGDDQTGRLPLPFDFSFYGQKYSDVFIASNGYLAFEDVYLGFSEYFNTAIPNRNEPNAAVYAAWQDLWVVGDSRVEYDLIEEARQDVLVIEYSNVPALGMSDGASFEVKLRADGKIDVLYGPGMANLLSGRNATAGIEAPGGTDGLQLAYQERVLTSGTAWRFQVVPTGFVAGTITNANDGEPVGGAKITASPGGRSTTTAADGTYQLRLVPGRYTITIEARNYEPFSMDVRIVNRRTTDLSRALRAPRAEVVPGSISATTELGDTVDRVVTLSNTGSAPLVWEARERDNGGTPPDLPPAPTVRVIRPMTWGPVDVPDGFGPSFRNEPTFAGTLEEVISDPIGDAQGSVDVTAVHGGADGSELSVRIDFADGTPMDQTVGVFYLDTDQNPSTGLPAEALFGLPTQDVGMEYFVDLFSAPYGFGYIIDANTFEFIGEIAVERTGQSYRFDVPLFLLGFDDGFVNVDSVFGDFFQPTDWAADVGHGTIQPFRDAPWMSLLPESGVIPAGRSVEVTLTLGGVEIDPGEYTGAAVFVTNDPRRSSHPVDVSLSVELPADAGSVLGTITNARAGYPVAGVVTVFAERDGEPVEVTAAADDIAGSYLLFAPEGTWPVQAGFEGYATFEGEVTIQAGFATTYDIALEPLWPNAGVDTEFLEFTIEPGATASAELVLTNTGGLVNLDFEVLERRRALDALVVPGASARPERTPPMASDGERESRIRRTRPLQQEGAAVLIFQDALPWDSDALQQVLSNNGIPYDLVGSAQMSTVDMSGYEVVFVSNDQPQRFYNAFTENASRFETYVDGGGFLWMGAAGWGWNEGDASGLPLPGGVTVEGPWFEVNNIVVQADHPVMTGVPEIFTGNGASHATFMNTPEGSTIAIGGDSGQPTLIEYGVGSGRVLAFGQTLEFAWMFGEDGAIILENSVPYAMAFEPFSDVEWLSVAPAFGSLAPDGVQVLTVTVNASGFDFGVFGAEVVLRTNDPLNRIIRIPVTMNVAG